MGRRSFICISVVLFLLSVVAGPLAMASDFVSSTVPASSGWAFAVGDFNGDGKIDLVMGTNSASNNVQVLLNNGSGVFTPKATYSIGSGVYSIVVADFNGNGKQDIAVVGYNSNSVTVLFGVGDGIFTAPTNYTVGFSHPAWISIGDFNGDGKPDLVVANAAGANNIAVLLNTCSGTCSAPSFAAATTYSVSGAPYGVAVGDFNGDGKLDLAASSSSGVSVLLGKGDGTFLSSVTYPTGSNSYGGVATADVNGDGKLDLLTANYGASSISVLLGNGNGTFQAKTDYATAGSGSSAYGIVTGDFNWDGKLDVAVTNYNGGSVSLLRGNGNGTFQPATTYGVGLSAPPNLVAADLNGDGRLDLAVATYGSSGALLLNNVLPPATFGQSFVPATDYASAGTGPGFAVAGDFNGDGKLDVAVPNHGGGDVGVLLGNGDGTLQPSVVYPAGTHPYAAAAGDFNGDGKLDLAIANFGDSAIGVLLGYGDGIFHAVVPYSVGTGPVSVITGDFNGDGRLDLAACNQTSNNVSLLLGIGDGTFQTASNYNAGLTPSGLATGDFNHDGKQDLVVANFGTNNIGVLLGNGNGTFQTAVNYAAATNPIAVVTSDFNHDGNVDVAVANYSSNNVSILLGQGDGTFNAAVNYPAGANPYSIAVTDINGDGRPDLVISDISGNNISTLLGKGDGTFNAAVSYPASTQSNAAPRSVIPVDLNGDGKSDLVVSNYGANTVSVLLNAGGTSITTSSSGASVVGQSVIFTAPVAHTIGSATPTGTVQFQEGASTLAAAMMDGSGTGSYTTSTLALGTHTISALYSGDEAFYPNTAPQISQVVSKSPTSIQITSANPNPALPNSSVTYYVSVLVPPPGGGTATGTVTLTDTGTTQSGCSAPGGSLGTAPLNGSAQASLSAVMGSQNIRNITATYSGDGNFLTSTSAIYQEDVRFASTTVLTSSTPTSNYGDPVTFTATVGTTGSVNFTDTTRSILLGTATLSSGVATFTTTALGAGSHNVTATYLGDCNYTTSISSPVTQTVSPVAGAMSLSSMMNPSFIKRASTFRATITPSTATGTVTFSDGGSTLGTASVINGVAQFTTLTLPAGTHTISANYAGDANVGGAAAGPITQNVTRAIFPVVQSFAAGVGPQSMVTVDFNGDGKPDIAVVGAATYGNFCQCETVSVLLGNADSTFQPAVTYTLTSYLGSLNPMGIATGDLDGDGKLDLVISDSSHSTITVLMGNGDGTFRSPVNYPAGGTNPYSVAIADFDKDGKLDLVTANWGSNNISVLHGNGNGTFASAVNYAVGTNPVFVTVGDFNKDGKLDLAVANSSSNNVSILLGNASGTFQPAVSYLAHTNPSGVVAADLDGDGNSDLAVSNSGSNDVSILKGNGNGSFQAPVNYHTSMNPGYLTAADMNGDGKLDLAVTNSTANTVSVLVGNGDGTFQNASTYGVPLPSSGSNVYGVAIADFNNDGKLDVVATDYWLNSVALLLGYGDGTLNAKRSNSAGNIGGNVSAMGFGDLDGDGKLDVSLAYVQTNNTNQIVERGDGNGNFAEPASFYSTSTGNGSNMVLADFNGDGKPDQALTAGVYNSINSLFVSLGDGNGSFNYSAMYNIGPVPPYDMPSDMVVGDFNNDGKLDTAVLERVGYTGGSNYVAVLLGDGTGHFSGPTNYGVGSIPMGLAVGDFNHDGKLDIAVMNQGDNSVGVLYGNGNGTFQAMLPVASVATNSAGIAAADFNGDGYPDLADSRSGVLSVLLNNGTGTFQPPVDYPVSGYASSLKVADLNGDGKLDLITNTGTVLVGNGDGTFQSPVTYDFGGSNFGLGEFNNDGALDAIATVGYYTYLTVAPNLRGSIASATFPSQINLGQTVNLPIAVAAGVNKWETPTGTVTVKDGSTVLGSATLSGGQANVSATFVNAGTRSLTVSYSGDAAFNPTASTFASYVSGLPPTIAQSFGAASIPLNGSTSLTFTVQNSNATTTLTGIGFSDTLPAGLMVSTPNGLSGSCGGGDITATPATNVISLSGANIAAGASCTFSVSVTGTALGNQVNTTSNVTSTEGGTGGAATASITVTFDMNVTGTSPVDGSSGVPLNAAIQVSFSAPMNAATLTANTSDSACTGSLQVSADNFATCVRMAGSPVEVTSSTFAITSAVPLGGSTTYRIRVTTAAMAAAGVNLPATFTTAAGFTTKAVLAVTSTTPADGSANVLPNSPVSFTFNRAATAATITVNTSGTACTGSVQLSTDPAFMTCVPFAGQPSTSNGTTFTMVPAALLTGTAQYKLRITTAALDSDGVPLGAAFTMGFITLAPPTITKTFGAASIPLQGTTSLSFTISNLNTNLALDGIAFTDNLPAGMYVSALNNLSNTCGGTAIAVPHSSSVSLSGASLAAASTCTVAINVDALGAGVLNNSVSVSSSNAGTGNTSTATITVIGPPTISTAFGAESIPVDGTTSLTFNLNNPNSTVALTGIAFTDSLPAGLVVAATPNVSTTCGGILTAAAGAGSISQLGGFLPDGGSCSISMTVQGTTAGVKDNITSRVDTTQTQAGTSGTASASITVMGTTTALTSNFSTQVAGAPVTFTAAITPSPASGQTITGTVSFYKSGTLLGTAAMGAGGTASYTTSFQVAGSNNILANYSGDSFYGASSGSMTEFIVAGTPAVILTVSGSGQTAMIGTGFASPLVVRVTDAFGNPAPGTSVTFAGPVTGASAAFPGGNSVLTDASGNASIIVAANGNAGTYAISAGVSGGATPASFTETNAPAPATIVVANDNTYTYDGTPKAAAYNVQPVNVASYSVSYTGISPTVYATSTTPPTDPGQYSFLITVTDPNYFGSASGTLVIAQDDPALNLALMSGSPEPSPYGTRVYFELTTASSPRCPTGAVNFYSDYVDNSSQPSATITLDGTTCNQPLEFSTAKLAPTGGQTHSITAVYSGDAYYAGATSNAVQHSVIPDGTAVTLATTGTTAYVGDTIRFTATVSPATGVDSSAAAPSGAVQFNEVTVDGQGNVVGTIATLGTVPLSASAPYAAAFDYASLPAATHYVQAVYINADGLFAGSSSAVGVETISLIAPSITWQPNIASIGYGTPLSTDQLNATAADGHNSNSPVAGTFTYNPPLATVLQVGSRNVTATFTPADPATYTSQTATVTITVTPATLTVTADSVSRSYGSANPPFTVQYSGFVNQEDSSVVTTPPVCSTTATASSAVGAYDINCSAGAAADYAFSYAKGVLTVSPANASVTPAAASKTYGSTDSALTGALAGFLSSDNVTASYSRTTGEAVAVYTISATLSPAGVLSNYSISYNTAAFTILPKALAVQANNATMIYGSPLPSLTGTITGAVSGDGVTANYSTTATSASGVGTYPITAGLSDPNGKLTNYSVTSTDGVLTITKAASAAVLQTNAATVMLKSNVSLSVRVTSATSGTPAGSVTFLDGGAALGSATLDSSGTASLILSTLAAGSHSITAAYAGDANFTGTTSATLNQTIEDFQLLGNGGSSSTLSAVVQAGGVATYQLQVTPVNGNTFASAVSFTLTGLPPGASYTISPATVAAGSGAQNVTVQVQTAKAIATVHKPGGTSPLAFTLGLLLPMVGMVRLRSRRNRRFLLLLLLAVIGLLGLSACGGGGSGSTTHVSQTYIVQLSATSGALVHSTSLSLTVQ